jgi:hypothetical protein
MQSQAAEAETERADEPGAPELEFAWRALSNTKRRRMLDLL